MNDNIQNNSDENIIDNIMKGQKDLFLIIVERYEDKLQRYINRFVKDNNDTQDILQNTFIKSFNNLSTFNSQYKFNSWIYAIAHNETINYINKNKIQKIIYDISLDKIIPFVIAKENTVKDLSFAQDKEVLLKHIENLKPKYKEVLLLYFFEDFSYNEISDILKIPVSTVGIRLKRAKECLSKNDQLQNLFK